jgi:hypothetical protein
MRWCALVRMPSRSGEQPATARRGYEPRAKRRRRELGSLGLLRAVGDRCKSRYDKQLAPLLLERLISRPLVYLTIVPNPFCSKILFSARGRVRSIFNGFGRILSLVQKQMNLTFNSLHLSQPVPSSSAVIHPMSWADKDNSPSVF